MRDESYGRHPIAKSGNPFICGLTGKTYTTTEAFNRCDNISKALAKIMGWEPNVDSPWDKVISVFSYNTIDYISVLHSIHRLSGIATPANVAYSASELEHQLKSSGAKVLFTCVPVLETALQAAKGAGIPEDKIFLIDLPYHTGKKPNFKTVDDLVEIGRSAPELEPLKWSKGQGARQPAFLCYSSGTSGLPVGFSFLPKKRKEKNFPSRSDSELIPWQKAVMISHRNVIANVLQAVTYESVGKKSKSIGTEMLLGLLPLSHIYGLVVLGHTAVWRGDQIVVLPRFEFTEFLTAIEKYRLSTLHVVSKTNNGVAPVLRFITNRT